VNDVYGECAERWSLHYREPASEGLFRRVAARVGAQCAAADQGRLQEELRPRSEAAEVLVVEVGGSQLPVRGEEPWKEAKVAVTYHHDARANEPVPGTSRYVAVVGGMGNFAPVLEEALENLVRYYRTNAHRMKYRLYREEGLPIGSGAVESAHRHVLQTRMKRAGQRWALPNARRMARLRAAYRTAGARRFYRAIRRAHRDTVSGAARARGRRQHFRYGTRDWDRCAAG